LRRISETSVFKRMFFLVSVLLLAGCSLEKKSAVNRGLQNLTAHYNILFNANELLRKKQETYASSYIDSYNEILSVYQDTTAKSNTLDKDMEDAKLKANKVINIKEQSHYLGDAYLVLGKADYLEGDYYDAVEFFSYVIRSFPQQKYLIQQAMIWKARSMFYLNQLPQAKLTIDSAIKSINPKKKAFIADIYATKMQYDINVQDYIDAEEMGKQAVHYCHDKPERLRWTFILAQIQELNNKPADAIKNYTSIVKSNASFEMAFNAQLNSIRIVDNQNGIKVSRIDRLKSLLKKENNKEFIDQIYFQIGEIYLANKNIDNAMKNYHLSTKYSLKNQNQKGLSYLRLADIYFKTKADYTSAKKYYDSTLMNLSPTYRGYQLIKKKGDNLQILADRFGIIAREDTLQMLAQLDEKTRAAHIDAMVNREILQQQAATDASNTGSATFANRQTTQTNSTGGSSFYFYNSNAISQGYSDFKLRWGNRKLEDNWRVSNRASSNITQAASTTLDPDAPADVATKPKSAPTAAGFRQQLIKDLPLTPDLLAKSNTRVYNAYFDIANFYRDILGDTTEAIATYELILKRFPDGRDKPAIYYNLYRLYSTGNPAKSDEYKNLLLKNYPETPFAKVIIDPEYSKKLNDADAALNALYNQVYDAYSKKDYKLTISNSDELLKQYPNNKWSAQIAYLRAMASGHLEKLDPFNADLNAIIAKYPNDRLIIPLVKQHLAYIAANQAEMASRPVVLVDNGPNGIPLVTPVPEQPTINYALQVAQKRIEPKAETKPPIVTPPLAKPTVAEQLTKKLTDTSRTVVKAPAVDSLAKNQPVSTPQVITPPKPKVPSIYSLRDSTNYYFVINVASGSTNLASSRFGIGQFNRANYQGSSIIHQLIYVGDNNTLIYVGRFYSIADVKAYARAIIPLMPDIMKVPKDEYSFFIITQQNLDKLTSKVRLDSYMDFYQNNY